MPQQAAVDTRKCYALIDDDDDDDDGDEHSENQHARCRLHAC